MVYIITDNDGFIKIGVTHDLNRRMRQLQNGNARNLELLMRIETGSQETDELFEKIIHHLFIGYRVRHEGKKTTEWFYAEAFEKLKLNTKKYVLRVCEIGGIHSPVQCFYREKLWYQKLKGA